MNPPTTEMVVAEQFADAEQQRDASHMGMWVFLMTEVMFFGGLFAAYAIYHHLYPEAFGAASRTTDFWMGTFNTAVLLCSSMTMAMSVIAARERKTKVLVRNLVLTMGLGWVFLGLKALEYYHHIADHLLPGPNFDFPGIYHNGAELFYFLYFAMTGLHATHMIIGEGVLLVLTYFAAKGKFTNGYSNPIEVAGLYWHFVDVVWIFLFPMLYLIGGH